MDVNAILAGVRSGAMEIKEAVCYAYSLSFKKTFFTITKLPYHIS